MKSPTFLIIASAALGLVSSAEEPLDTSALQKAAIDFVTAYNARDPEALSTLFTEDGEMVDLLAEDVISGRSDIKAHYEEVFAGEVVPEIALDVTSVRIVAPNLAIEDGTAHFTPPGDNEPPRSTAYTAVLQKVGDEWKVASSRSLADATDAAGQLADLAKVLNGEWTAMTTNGVRVDLAIGWDSTGKFLTGDILVTAPDTPPQEAKMRIAWNAARKSINSWTFDTDGGISQGTWIALENGWSVRSEGTSAEGDGTSSQMGITKNGSLLVWEISHRIAGNEQLPDVTLRLAPATPSIK